MINYIELLKWYNKYRNFFENFIIRNIFGLDDGIIIEFFSKGLNFKYLYIIPGKIIFLSNEKKESILNNFVLKLRKDFKNKNSKLYIDNEYKIVIIESEDKFIYSELISNGLIIVTDKRNIILYANKYKNFGSREIKKNIEYKKPLIKDKIFIDFDDFKNTIINSNKKDIVRILAVDIQLGKKYAEYILNQLKIDKNRKDLNNNEILLIFNKYKEILNSDYIIDDNFNIINDINNYFEKLYFNDYKYYKIKRLEEEKNKILNIIKSQEESLKEIEDKINNINKIAEFLTTYSWIFNNYDIEKIKDQFKSLNIDVDIKKDGYKIILEIKEM